MKTKFCISVTILIMFIITGACKNDSTENSFSYDGITYSLSGGLLSSSDSKNSGGGYSYVLTLYSSGLSYNTVDQNISGTGELLFFLISSSSSPLGSGSYKYNNSNTANAPGTYSDSWFKHNLIVSSNSCTNIQLSAGTLGIVNTSSTVYSININIKTKEGKSINGYYKGSLISY
jgi:hypothetical protein